MEIIKGLLIVVHTIGWIGALVYQDTGTSDRRCERFIYLAVVTFLLYLLVHYLD